MVGCHHSVARAKRLRIRQFLLVRCYVMTSARPMASGSGLQRWDATELGRARLISLWSARVVIYRTMYHQAPVARY